MGKACISGEIDLLLYLLGKAEHGTRALKVVKHRLRLVDFMSTCLIRRKVTYAHIKTPIFDSKASLLEVD